MPKYVKRTCTLQVDVEVITCARCHFEQPLVPTDVKRTQTQAVQLVVPPAPAHWLQLGRDKLCPSCAESYSRWKSNHTGATANIMALSIGLKRIEDCAAELMKNWMMQMDGDPLSRATTTSRSELFKAIADVREILS